MIIIGERINSTRESVREALEKKDESYIRHEARIQADESDFIDVNAAALTDLETDRLVWLVETVQHETSKPLCIDTPNPDAALEALKVHQGRAVYNSITAQKESLSRALPVVETFKPFVVGLLMGDEGIPETTEARLKAADTIVNALAKIGLELKDVFLDLLIQPLSYDPSAPKAALRAAAELKKTFPEVRICCGLSNISYGLPKRRIINRSFLSMLLFQGLDAAILDPCDRSLMSELKGARALLGGENETMAYIQAYRKNRLIE